MQKSTYSRKFSIFVIVILPAIILCSSRVSGAIAEDDVKCLKGLKSSLDDPEGKLNSWSFTNTSIGFICNFVGVTCWNNQENRVISVELRDMTLNGQIDSLMYCQSLQTLDLSENMFSGTIPEKLCDWMPFLVSLDLSNNKFSGSIPPELGNCTYLNKLILSDNHLSGNIPYEFSHLNRLKTFSVANNDLRGEIPSDLSNFDSANFKGNKLCGKPLGKCGGLSKKNLAIIIAAGVFGAAVSLLLAFGLWWWCHLRNNQRRKTGFGIDDTNWVERLKPYKLVQVSLFQKPLVKVKLSDLMAATNNFDPENIIFSTRTGTTYKAVLPDGSTLAIKRLNTCKLSEKQFRMEMHRLGELRHPNLAPLLGFCVVEEERLLVYKHMSNGTVNSLLHSTKLDWPTGFRIGFGAAKGLSWLHHGVHPPILHQNICSNVILIDEDFDSRIVDFGLAGLMTAPNPNERSFVNGDQGEFGYVAPEYSSAMVSSLKGDVYAFGVVLLELVTGQKPLEVSNVDEAYKGNLAEWVNHLSISGRVKEAINRDLCGKGYDDEIVQVLKIACKCVTTRPKDRWSMFKVYESLKGMAEKHGFSEQLDDFPLVFARQDNEPV
ncbi:hypothetical protein ACFE04_010684 [Oxalis oulophora]